MNGTCTIHDNAIMTERTSKTKFDADGNPKTYFAHSGPDGKLCFGESIKKSQNNNRAYTSPAKSEAKQIDPEVWAEKDRGILACCAMNNASPIIVAMINAGIFEVVSDPIQAVKDKANELYEELKKMKIKV